MRDTPTSLGDGRDFRERKRLRSASRVLRSRARACARDRGDEIRRQRTRENVGRERLFAMRSKNDDRRFARCPCVFVFSAFCAFGNRTLGRGRVRIRQARKTEILVHADTAQKTRTLKNNVRTHNPSTAPRTQLKKTRHADLDRRMATPSTETLEELQEMYKIVQDVLGNVDEYPKDPDLSYMFNDNVTQVYARNKSVLMGSSRATTKTRGHQFQRRSRSRSKSPEPHKLAAKPAAKPAARMGSATNLGPKARPGPAAKPITKASAGAKTPKKLAAPKENIEG